MADSITWPDGTFCDFANCPRCTADCDIRTMVIALMQDGDKNKEDALSANEVVREIPQK